MPLVEFQAEFPVICGRLREVRAGNRRAHATLFTGDDPALLERFALAWAQACACVSPGDGDACGRCPACRAFAAGRYTELHELRPESRSRIIPVGNLDKDRPRGVRHLIHELGFTAAEGFLKVGFVMEAERMNAQAQNAFLKTLEEPPRDTLLLLTSANPRQLLPTVRSRCQIIPLLTNRRTYAAVAERGLFQLLALLRPRAGAAAALEASGGLLRMLGLLRQELEAGAEAAPMDATLAELARTDKSVLKELEEQREVAGVSAYLQRRRELLDAIQAWFQQLLLHAAGVPDAQLPHPELFTAAGGIPDGFDPDTADRFCRLAADLARQLDGNLDERLGIEAWCLELCERPAPPPAPSPLGTPRPSSARIPGT